MAHLIHWEMEWLNVGFLSIPACLPSWSDSVGTMDSTYAQCVNRALFPREEAETASAQYRTVELHIGRFIGKEFRMSLFSWLYDSLSNRLGNGSTTAAEINPASGLPMVGGVDIRGNPFGTNLHSHWLDDSPGVKFSSDSFTGSAINPASGLPMVGRVDIYGDPFGTNFHSHHSSLSSHDSFSPSSSSLSDHWHRSLSRTDNW